jgi:hypothetical protein
VWKLAICVGKVWRTTELNTYFGEGLIRSPIGDTGEARQRIKIFVEGFLKSFCTTIDIE